MSSPKWRPTRSSKPSGVEKFLDSFSTRKNDLPRSRLEDLVGEAAQNALDAVLGPDTPVDIEFEVRSVDPKNPEWAVLIGKQATIDGNFKVLRISNRNARGLNGAHGNGPPDGDYQKFMGFDGDSGKTHGGGAYGYGRSTYFTASRSRRLLVDSVYKDHRGVLMRRLVGVRFMTKDELVKSKEADDRAYHAGSVQPHYCDGIEVWGTADPGDVVLPIEELAGSRTGVIANIAKSMKLHRKPGDEVEGTDFYVLDLEATTFLCEPHGPQSLEEHLSGALLWRLWPALQDGAATAGVVQSGVRTEIRLDPEQEDLWPVLAFAQLRDLARGRTVVDKIGLGGSSIGVYKPNDEATPAVCAASFTLPGPNRPVRSCLKVAYPGSKFWDPNRLVGVVSVVRFRTNKLVVNYEDHVHCAGKPETSLTAPSDKRTWTLGVLEVVAAGLSDDIRSGRKTAGGRRRKIEDISHTHWSWAHATAMQGFEAIAQACKYLADHIGTVAAVPATLTDQSGAAFWSRNLGKLFPARRGAPGKSTGGGGDGGPGEGDKRSKKLRPLQPQMANNSKCYVFDTTGLDAGKTYVLKVEVQSVNTNEKDLLANAAGYVLDGAKTTSLDFESFTPAAGQQVAIKMPETPVAVTVTATLRKETADS